MLTFIKGLDGFGKSVRVNVLIERLEGFELPSRTFKLLSLRSLLLFMLLLLLNVVVAGIWIKFPPPFGEEPLGKFIMWCEPIRDVVVVEEMQDSRFLLP